MRRVTVLATLIGLASAPAAVAAPPPSPTPPTTCARALVLDAAGATAGCDTLSDDSALASFRQVVLSVQSGAATATLTCGGVNPGSVTVTAAAPYTRSAPLLSNGYCWVVATALFDNTTAVVVDTYAPNVSLSLPPRT